MKTQILFLVINPGTRVQVDVPRWPKPVHPDQLILRLRRCSHRSQHLRGGRPGHRSVKQNSKRSWMNVSIWMCKFGVSCAQVRALTTSGSFAAALGPGIVPSPCCPATSPRRPAPPCDSPTVVCSAFSWVRACSGSESERLLHAPPRSSTCAHWYFMNTKEF